MKKQQYIVIGVLIILIFSYFLYRYYSSNNKQLSYKNNSVCAENALSFAKEKNISISNWDVLQSKFIANKNACFAEFSIGSYSAIYDLTHNKELALNPPLLGEVNDNYTKHVEDFKKLKSEIFGY